MHGELEAIVNLVFDLFGEGRISERKKEQQKRHRFKKMC